MAEVAFADSSSVAVRAFGTDGVTSSSVPSVASANSTPAPDEDSIEKGKPAASADLATAAERAEPKALAPGSPAAVAHDALAHADPALRQRLQMQPDNPNDPNGGYTKGKLHFASGAEYAQYVRGQIDAWSEFPSAADHAKQLSTLDQLQQHGIESFEGQTPRAPAGTTMESLIAPSGKPDANGYYHLGNLTVSSRDLADFQRSERSMDRVDPEAKNVLYRLEHQDKKTTLVGNDQDQCFADQVHHDAGRQDPNEGEDHVIYYDFRKVLIENGTKQPPDIGFLHEQTHATEDDVVSRTLQQTPDAQYDNKEERRVIDGVEQRAMRDYGLTPRFDHSGTDFNTGGVNHVQPVVHFRDASGASHTMVPGDTLSGSIVASHGDTVTIRTDHGQLVSIAKHEFDGAYPSTSLDSYFGRVGSHVSIRVAGNGASLVPAP